MKDRSDLLQGTLDLLILKALTLGPNHGLGVARRVDLLTGGTFQVKPGSLFPALHRLEERGWLDSKWGFPRTTGRPSSTPSPEPAAASSRPSRNTGGASRWPSGARWRRRRDPARRPPLRESVPPPPRRWRSRRRARFVPRAPGGREDGEGNDPGAALRAARLELGSPDDVKERVRDVRAGAGVERMARNIRFGLRSLRRTPGFTAFTVLTFALAIGGITVIFSLVDALLLRPLPYPGADRIVMVMQADAANPANGTILSAPNYHDLERRSRAFERMALYEYLGFNLSGEGEPEQVGGLRASSGLFQVLGVKPMLGRALAPGDDVPGSERVVVLSHALWQRRFGGDSSIVGKPIRINQLPYVVIGVMPRGFAFPSANQALWTSISFNGDDQSRGSQSFLRGGAPQGRHFAGAGPERDPDPRRSAGQGVPRDERRNHRYPGPAARAVDGEHRAYPDRADGGGVPGAGDRLGQHREPAGGAGNGPAPGDRGPLGPGRNPGPGDGAAGDRERAAGAGRRVRRAGRWPPWESRRCSRFFPRASGTCPSGISPGSPSTCRSSCSRWGWPSSPASCRASSPRWQFFRRSRPRCCARPTAAE